MKYDYQYIYSLFKDIYIEDEFYDDCEFTYDIIKQLKKDDNVEIRTGASKLVCILSNENYVIKVPFNMIVSEDEDNEDGYEPLMGASEIGDCSWDYCAREVFLYGESKEVDISFAFPETQYIGEINGWPVYIQEACVPIYEQDQRKTSEKSLKQVEKTLSSYTYLPCFNKDWMAIFYEQYGEEKLIELLDFIQVNNINDLHNGNIGFSLVDNRPVIIDFSGFNY